MRNIELQSRFDPDLKALEPELATAPDERPANCIVSELALGSSINGAGDYGRRFARMPRHTASQPIASSINEVFAGLAEVGDPRLALPNALPPANRYIGSILKARNTLSLLRYSTDCLLESNDRRERPSRTGRSVDDALSPGSHCNGAPRCM